MGVFRDLMDRLELDVATVHDRRLPIVWRFDPDAPPAFAWAAFLELPDEVYEPRTLHLVAARTAERDEVAKVDVFGLQVFLGASGEDPLRRMAEHYAPIALRRRELVGA